MLFWLITLAPVLQIIPLHEIVANHYLYLPMFAFSGIFSLFFERLLLSLKQKISFGKLFFTFFFIAISCFFIFKTISRNFELKNIWTALKADEKYKPLSFRGLFTIGAKYMEMKFPDEAFKYYKKAIKTNNYDGILYANIIGYYLVKGDFDNALKFYNWTVNKKRYVFDSGRLYIAIIYTIKWKCNNALNIIKYIGNYPNLKNRIKFVKNCKKYKLGNEKTVEDFLKSSNTLKKLGFNIERKVFLKQLINSGYFENNELIELVDELAKIDFISDIPEAIKYYNIEKQLLKNNNKKIPVILNKTITALKIYEYKVLKEGKYFKINF